MLVRKVATKFRRYGVAVEVIGFNLTSTDMIESCALHDKTEARGQSFAALNPTPVFEIKLERISLRFLSYVERM